MITYVGRDKDQGIYSTCATHALTAWLTQWYYNTYGEVKEFDVNDINPDNEMIPIETLFDILRTRGISEEGKSNNQEFVINLKQRQLMYVEDVLNSEELIIAGITGLDLNNPLLSHSMLYLGAEYVSPSIYDVHFQNSYGSGIIILRNQNLAGLIATNMFREVTLKENYYRLELEVQNNVLEISNDYDTSKPLLIKQVKNGENVYTTVAPVRKVTEALGDNCTWIPSDGINNNKVLFTSKSREVI